MKVHLHLHLPLPLRYPRPLTPSGRQVPFVWAQSDRGLQPALRDWLVEGNAAYTLRGTPTVLVNLGSAPKANATAMLSSLVRMRHCLQSIVHVNELR